MSAGPIREDTTLLVRRMAAGQAEALDVLWVRYDEKIVRAASVAIRRFNLDPMDLDADGAANFALFKIIQAANRGKLDAIQDSDHFWGYFARVLEGVLKDASDQQRARKRGGTGRGQPREEHAAPASTQPVGTRAGQGFQRTDADLENLQSPHSSAHDVIAAKEEYESFAQYLECDILRAVLHDELENRTNVEIGARNGLSTHSVERRLRLIRLAYFRFKAEA